MSGYTKEELEFIKKLEDLELYSAPKCYEQAVALFVKAEDLFCEVLDYYGLRYSNPGEPEAENEDRSVVIPLWGGDDGMLTGEEEENGAEISVDLYHARLRASQARDILDNGWQWGLEAPAPNPVAAED